MHTNSNICHLLCAGILAIITPFYSFAQLNKLEVIHNKDRYVELSRKDSMQEMVPLSRVIEGVIMDLRYATKQNFTHKQLYPTLKETYLRKGAATALSKVQDSLRKMGIGIKIWDAYRPFSVTKKMWKLIGDERYVANPAKGSGHNRGIAVDVTLVWINTSKELDMGTGFDHFSDTAHHDFKHLTAEQHKNRQLLKTIMEQFGFKALPTEWWHYSLPDPARYPVLDLSFRQLAKLTD